MKKIIYVAKSIKEYGDSFDIAVSFDKDEATEAAIYDRKRLSQFDKEKCFHMVEGYEIDVADGETAREAYDNWLLETNFADPLYCEQDFNMEL